MRCPRCGHENDENSRFCSNCGSPLISETQRQAMRAAQEIRKKSLEMISSRILTFTSFISMIAIIVSLFLPYLTIPFIGDIAEVGGLAWFTNIGQQFVEDGKITVGSYYLTMVFYYVVLVATIALVVLALSSAIKSYRNRTAFKASQYMLIIIAINELFYAILENFYFYYQLSGNAYAYTKDGLGSIIFGIGVTIFIIPFAINLILKGVFSESRSDKGLIIASTIIGYLMFRNYSDYLTSTGVVNYQSRDIYLLGLLHYFDAGTKTATMGPIPSVMGLLCFVFGALLLLMSLFFFCFTSYQTIKRRKVDAYTYLIFAISNMVVTILFIVFNYLFAYYINLSGEFAGFNLYLNTSLLAIVLYAIIMLVIAIIFYRKKLNENSNVTYTTNNGYYNYHDDNQA